MSESTMAQRLAQFAHRTSFDSLPYTVVASVQAKIRDVVGLYCASGGEQAAVAVRTWVARTGGSGASTAVGVEHGVPAASAAMLNGVLAHALDYDDTHLPSILHPSASVVPAVLAVAEDARADGQAVIEAVAVGLEVCVRLGMVGFDSAAGNSLFFEHGQHATAICGTVAVAAAVAKLHGATTDEICSAMGIAASQASGIIEANRTGGTVKQLHCGWSAHAGVIAGQLARLAMTGPPTVLEGRFGFFQAFLHREPDAHEIDDGLGRAWRLEEIHIKPYPTNHFAQAGIDAALALRQQGVRARDVERVELGVAGPTVRTIGEPIEAKRRPQTGYAAKFSGPFTFATALMGGAGLGVGHDDFADENVHLPDRLALMDRTFVVDDDWCTARYPWALPARVTVRTRDGSELVEKVAENRGGPQNPLTLEELRRKFTDNAALALPPDDIAALDVWADSLPQASDVSQGLAVLRRVRRPSDTDA